MQYQWKASGDRVLIDVPPVATKTQAGIVLPDKFRGDKVGTGIVVAAGPQALNVKPGDTVYFNRTPAAVTPIDGTIVSVLIEDIYAVQRPVDTGGL
jgi:co-chaperonin GroES (HSP10)